MRQIREVLRLHAAGRTHREIATALQLSRATVWEYLDRARRARLECGHALSMSDDALDHLLFPPSPPSNAKRPMPNWPQVHRELGRKHLTLDLLWNEYKLQEPDGYGYSWLLAQWAKTDVLVMDDLAMTPLTDSIAYRAGRRGSRADRAVLLCAAVFAISFSCLISLRGNGVVTTRYCVTLPLPPGSGRGLRKLSPSITTRYAP
jgi:hypothetical protein